MTAEEVVAQISALYAVAKERFLRRGDPKGMLFIGDWWLTEDETRELKKLRKLLPPEYLKQLPYNGCAADYIEVDGKIIYCRDAS